MTSLEVYVPIAQQKSPNLNQPAALRSEGSRSAWFRWTRPRPSTTAAARRFAHQRPGCLPWSCCDLRVTADCKDCPTLAGSPIRLELFKVIRATYLSYVQDVETF